MADDPESERQLQRSITNVVENSSGYLREIEDELAIATPRRSSSSALSRINSLKINDGTEENLYVAVGKDYRNCKSVLIWALRKSRRTKKFVLLHVHRPSQMIRIMGGWFHVSQLTTDQIETYRNQEREKMNKTMKEYMFICEIAKVHSEMLVIEADDLAKALIDAISEHGITRLVMGAASGDNDYTKGLRSPVSKTPCILIKEAPSSCNIWFICKGNLICTREDNNMDANPLPSSSLESPRARTGQSRLQRSRSASQSSSVFEQRESVGKLPDVKSIKRNSVMSVLDANEREESDPLSSKHDSTMAKTESSSELVQWEEPRPEEDDWNIHLKMVVAQAAKLMKGAKKESQMRSQAERAAYDANQRASALESSIAREIILREEARQSIVDEKSKFENMKIQFQQVLKELEKIENTNSTMKEKITESVDRMKTLETNLSMAETLMKSMQKERDNAIRELEKSSSINSSSKNSSNNFMEFSYEELEQATCRFEKSLKIGEGVFGCIYKGYIRHTKVAIKVLNPESLQNRSDFLQEVGILSRLRHPNLLTLMGVCPESLILVYEFLSNGSLEDRLSCKDGTAPLSWQIRTRISAEICSSLIFLHSNKPSAVIHGDLRPANILLDVNLVSKLSDFSISRLLIQSAASHYNWSDSKGMFVYVDPEFFSTGELRAHSDVYSFGIILLRLVTGQPALGIVKQVQEALEKGKLQEIVDISAGDWPYKKAHLIATLGLKCCEMKRRNRPDLVRDVLTILEPMKLSTFT